jgi:hypothetical protein
MMEFLDSLSGLPGFLILLFIAVWCIALFLLPLIVLGIHSKNAAILEELRLLNRRIQGGIDVTPKRREQ